MHGPSSITHLDLSENQFSSKTIVHFLIALQSNHILQEFKLTIGEEELS